MVVQIPAGFVLWKQCAIINRGNPYGFQPQFLIPHFSFLIYSCGFQHAIWWPGAISVRLGHSLAQRSVA